MFCLSSKLIGLAPHIGHLYSAVIADAHCRYQRLKYPERKVRLCTGTDEHGTKIQQAAALHKVPVATYCDQISERYREVFQNANILQDDFIRTTEERHKRAVAHFWVGSPDYPSLDEKDIYIRFPIIF